LAKQRYKENQNKQIKNIFCNIYEVITNKVTPKIVGYYSSVNQTGEWS